MPRHPSSRVARFCALALASVAIGHPTLARAADESLAILGIEAIEVGDAYGTQVTDALRRRAAETSGVRLVPGKDLIELKMVFGCDGEAPACLAQAGRSLGADRLIYGTLKKADGGRSVAVLLKLLDVRDLAVVRQVTEIFPRKALTPAAIQAAAGRWFGQLVVPAQTGGLTVQSQPSGGQVMLDGASVGTTPLKLKDLRPRSYSVEVQLEGHAPAAQTIEVHAGATESVFLRLTRDLRPEPARPPQVGVVEPLPNGARGAEPSRPRHPGRPAKYAALGLIAGAVVAGAVAIYTWRSYVSLEESGKARLAEARPPSGTAEQQRFFAETPCTAPPGIAPSDSTRAYLANCESGNKYANATTGLWVTAGVLATAGVVSFIVGQRLDAKAEKAAREHGLRQSLRLVPALSTKGGGLQASFEF